jgi:putative oxygen-independent coproporphyrinogen III oxidase
VPPVPRRGDATPGDGRLPGRCLAEAGSRPFGIYLHVPFCSTRCGYCDFNTYTATELGTNPGATPGTWADAALAELDLARRVLGGTQVRVHSVFVGGGTPSLLAPGDLGRVLVGIDDRFGLAEDVEVTSEANPESATPEWLAGARRAGVNRLSLGMQSVCPHVLAVLDRVHSPGRVAAAVADARAAGFDNLSLDLIYGTPGETPADWARTLEAALALGPEHVSAYALIVEQGTRLAARIGRGELPRPDDDVMAAMYEVADETFAAAGLHWYEVSNWARAPHLRSRHNWLYWTDADWWGVGPGAHSHVGGTRWWNVKHPAAWAQRLVDGVSPAAAREVLDAATRRTERIMLGLRTVAGASTEDIRAAVGPVAGARLAGLVDDELLEPADLRRGRAVLTRRGRLLADAVTVRLT